MTKEQIDLLAKELNNELMNLYCTYISPGECDPLILNGYCLYFAALLQELLKDGKVMRIPSKDHYIFCYEKEYFDGLGIIEKYHTVLNSYAFGFIPIDILIEVKEIQEEIDYTSCCDLDYSKKQFVWQKIKPDLQKYGRKRIHEIKTSIKREKVIPK